jgi:hypothetical protein
MAQAVNTRPEFEQALANGQQSLLLVVGSGPEFSDIAQHADNAIMFPQTQGAVWVRDPAILTPAETQDYLAGNNGFVACALSRNPRKVCARITRDFARSLVFVQALAAAESGVQPPLKFG